MKQLSILLFCLVSFCSFSQKRYGTLILNDQSTITGNFRFSKDEKKVIVKDKKGVKQKIVTKNISELQEKDEKTGNTISYVFKRTEKRQRDIFPLKILQEGKLVFFERDLSIPDAGGGSGTVVKRYYISKKGEEFVVQIRVGSKFKKFEKIIQEYFSDCKDVVSKIKADFFGGTVEDVEKMVIYYNSSCK